MAIRLEHANLSVRDIHEMIRFLQTAFPEFRVRGEGITRDGAHWVHVGTDDTYIALSESRVEPPTKGARRCRVESCPQMTTTLPPGDNAPISSRYASHARRPRVPGYHETSQQTTKET